METVTTGPTEHRRPSQAPTALGNSTLVNGIVMLKSIARSDRPISLAEISRAMDMPPSSALRYVRGLVHTQMLSHDPETGKYELGQAVIELGLTAIGRIDAVRLATDLMAQLTNLTGLVSIISVWGSDGPTVIRWEQGRLESSVKVREGITLPLLRTAAGRVFLAYLPADEIRDHLGRETAAWNRDAAPDDIMTPEKIEALRQEIRGQGISRAVGEQNPALAALSAPIFDGNGALCMSLTIINAVGSFDTDYHGEPARQLKRTAETLSRRLGWPGA